MVMLTFDASIPDLHDHLAGIPAPGSFQEKIHQRITTYRAVEAVLAFWGTPEDADRALEEYIKALKPALRAVTDPPWLQALNTPDAVHEATARTLARMIATAEGIREELQPLLPRVGGQPASKNRDLIVYHIADLLRDTGVKNYLIRTARILCACGVPAPATGEGIGAIYHRETQKRNPGRRTIRL